MNQINNLHEEAVRRTRRSGPGRSLRALSRPSDCPLTCASQLQQAAMLRKEAAADKEAAEMIRQRLMSSPLAHAHSAAPPAAGSEDSDPLLSQQLQQLGASASPAVGPSLSRPAPPSLKDTMGLPSHLAGVQTSCERVLPHFPFKSMMAHKGGCCSVASQVPGEWHSALRVGCLDPRPAPHGPLLNPEP